MGFKSGLHQSPPFSFRRLVREGRRAAVSALVVFWLGSFFAATPQVPLPPRPTVRQAGKLELNRPIERDLGPQQTDAFTVDAAAGQFLRVVANQKGVDVWVRIVDAEGKAVVTANRPGAFGPESASVIVPASVPLQIRVEMAPNTSEAGHYAMELTDLRDPTEKDRLRIDAETKLFAAITEGRDQANRRKAIDHFTEAASLWHDLQGGHEEGLCLDSIGNLYRGLGDDQKALDYYLQALPVWRTAGDQWGEGATLDHAAGVYYRLGDKQKALDYFQQALERVRSVGSRTAEGSTLNSLGDIYFDLGERQRALDSYTQALSISRSAPIQALESVTLFNLAKLYKLPAAAASTSAAQPGPENSFSETQVNLVAQAGTSVVSAIAFSPDGRFVLTAGGEKVAILFAVDEAKEIRRFEGHEETVTSVAFLPDGDSVVTGSLDKTVRIWNMHTGRELQRLTDSISVGAIAVSPKGDLIATAGGPLLNRVLTVHLLDRQSGKNIRSFDGHKDPVRALAFSPDGKWLATASADHTARLWDVATGKEVRLFSGHESPINAIAFSPDGILLATGSGATNFDGMAAAAKDTRTLPIQERMSLANEYAASSEHTIRVWNVSTATETRRIDAPATVLALAFSPDGGFLASGAGSINLGPSSTRCTGCDVRLVDVRSGQETNRFPTGGNQTGVPMPASALTFSRRMILASSDAVDVVIRSADSGKEVSRLRGYAQPGRFLSVSADNRFIASSGALWDNQTGRPSPVYPGQLAGIAGLSSDGAMLAAQVTQPGSADRQIGFWDVRKRNEIRRLSTPGAIQACSPDGRFVLVSAPQQECLIETGTGAEVHCFPGAPGSPQGFFSPAGDAIIFVSSPPTAARALPATVSVWDIKTRTEVLSFKAAFGPTAISPTGELIAMGLTSTQIYSWKTGALVRELYTGALLFRSFSPDGRWLAGLSSGHVGIWDATTGQEKLELPMAGLATDTKFSSDGRFVFTTGFGGVTAVWDFSTGRQLCSLVSFTDGSWAVTDPDGRYDASNPDEAIGLHWVVGDEVIELGQLKQRFYTPGLFARVLKGEALPDVASIRTVKLFPSLEVAPPAPGSTRLNVKLTNRGGGIGRVVVKVNGKELPSGERGAPVNPDAATAQIAFDLAGAVYAADGRNSIEVIAYDGHDLLSSRGVRVEWKTNAAPTAKQPRPRLFAVVAGVSEYDNSDLNLSYPAKDAESMYEALRLAGEGLFGKGQVSLHLLSTSGKTGSVLPTKDAFRTVFGSVIGEAESQDVLVVYLAGHGVARRGIADEYYFLTTAARNAELPANDLVMLDRAAVSSEELKDWLLKVKALKQVIILDTCAAGAAISELIKLAGRRDLSPDQARAMELLKDSTGSHILMGSASDSVSYEASRYGQGLLTYALLQGMKGEALDEGKSVDVLKLFNFASNRVVQLASGIGGIQQPQISSPGGRSFPIGLLSDQDKRAIPLASAKPQLLRLQIYDSQEGDSLGLGTRVRALLKESSLSATRGNGGTEPAVVYVDEALDIATAISPLVRYQVQGARLEARVILRRDDKVVSNDTVTASADPTDAARQITDAIIKAATKVGGQ